MGINTNPYAGKSVITIEARPEEHEAAIERQGQSIRLIQAKKCPCINQGKAEMFCDLCKGKGYILGWQTEYEVIDENSPHGDCNNLNKIYPYWIPLLEIKQIQRRLLDIQGGNLFYTVDSFNDIEITLTDNGELPKRHEQIKVTYKYKIQNEVIDENSIANGTYIIKVRGTKILTNTKTSNPFNINGDIYSVSKCRNVTQSNYDYTVLSFGKQSITVSDDEGAAPIPQSTDTLEVSYKYTPPLKAGCGKVNPKYAMVKWGEDLKQGDIECLIPGGYFVKRGNIITLLTAFFIESVVIKRGAENKDELPFFDVAEIIGDIIDEEKNEYTSSDFTLQNYNDLVWGVTKPTQGKKYSVTCRFNPSYMVYKEDPGKVNAEDKRFPQMFLLRIFNRFTTKELEIL